jgi:HAD superfamily hydrolase (TIGR01509 family)
MIKAVIFDMDGVIYYSSPYVWKARNVYLKKYGVQISDEEIPKLLGKSLRDQLAYINQNYNLSIKYDDFSKRTRELQVQLMKNDLKPCEGAVELIGDLLRNDVKITIASSNLRRFIEEDLGIMKLRDKFEVITSVEDVENHKPHPDIFLVAAEKLGVPPDECVVIEDAINGIEAAKRAGMKAIAVLTEYHKKEEFTEADMVVKSLKELDWEKIKKLGSNSRWCSWEWDSVSDVFDSC